MAKLHSLSAAVVGALLLLYGLVCLLYNADGGHTYVTVLGQSGDAHAVGAISLALGAAAIAAARRLWRKARRSEVL